MEFIIATQLRWFLLIIGIVIVIITYFYTKRTERKQQQAEKRRKLFINPVTSIEADEVAEKDGLEEEALPEEALVHENTADEDDKDGRSEQTGDKLMALHVRASAGRDFSGAEIASIARQQGLHVNGNDTSGFFELISNDTDGSTTTLFYVANMFKPGTFEWSKLSGFQTQGLTLFTRFPNTIHPLNIFNQMLFCAQQFSQKLGGIVLNENHQELTDEVRQSIEDNLTVNASHSSKL